jgi:hypothetical protein
MSIAKSASVTESGSNTIIGETWRDTRLLILNLVGSPRR